ncbi:MAG TPA: inositol monophosphatase family protein [Longimicrobiales bacterium]
MTESRELLETALDAARAAVDVHRRHLGRVRVEDWSEKGVADFVTHVDREAEERILGLVTGRFPDHAVLAEEGATAVAEAPAGSPAVAAPDAAEWLWVIDPLDGTTNFLHGYPMYSASVAVLHRGEPVAGAVVSGATGEEWTALRGGGAFRDGMPIRVSAIDRLKLALIGTGFPFKTIHELPRYLRQLDGVLRRTAGIRRGGSAALDLCHVATGYLDGFWELSLAPWDFAAGALVVREAGGIVTTVDGDALDLRAGGSVLAGNPAIHQALRNLLESLG